MITTNLAIVIAGVGLFASGLYVKYADQGSVGKFLDLVDQYDVNNTAVNSIVKYLPTANIVLGSFLLLMGLLGCCGAMYKSRGMLCMFAFILTVLFVAEIGIGNY
jgi:hypothetical protein